MKLLPMTLTGEFAMNDFATKKNSLSYFAWFMTFAILYFGTHFALSLLGL